MKKEHATALIIFRSGFTKFHLMQLLELATKNRLPTMCGESGWSEAGCLMSYGASITDQLRRTAVFVDKILKKAKPADLHKTSAVCVFFRELSVRSRLDAANRVDSKTAPFRIAWLEQLCRSCH